MTDDDRLPRAFVEALTAEEAIPTEDARRQVAEVVDALSGWAESQRPSVEVAERLLRDVGVAPLRYAPFFSRLAELLDLDEHDLERTVECLADPRSWRSTGLKGVERIEVTAGARMQTVSASFVRFAPGTHFPRHRHQGFEQVFVLEGSYTDDEGVLHGAGNLHEMQDGTEHEFWVAKSGPCIAVNVLHGGLRFTRWPAKLFNFFMKR